ncbi:MAG: serine/threonine-protein kinase [Acidobacteriota bacterium]|nr:serine/threonine-protein kinase [Acidobacteriota bacterium]
MDTKRWNRVKDIFGEAMEQPAHERMAYVCQMAGDDQDVLEEVCSLLAVDDEEVSFLEAAPAPPDEEPDKMLGSELGPWKLARKLDSGGMGKVYVAERADRLYKDRVAIKVLKRGMDTDEVVRRFRRERQILAHLDHPYITRLMDGGSTADGRPYLVMEYVDGEHITKWCREKPLRERLQVFLKVCEGVSFAHSNLIVHRDLKPGNILVTDRGEPKLLDFGIAKLLDPDEGQTHTRIGQRLLTPAYAAPEQIRGEAITTACDVFALGVLLFEVLVGQLPERSATGTTGPGRGSLERMPIPSKAVGPHPGPGAVQKRLLTGDLDTIVLKALREDPAKRYHSADEMAEDIGRYLEGFPVRARRETVVYQMSKFFGRHRLGVSIFAMVVTLLLSLLVALITSQDQVARERDEAMASAELMVGENRRLARVHELLVETISKAGLDNRETVNIESLLDKTADQIQKKPSRDPGIQADRYLTLASIHNNRGHPEKAEPLLRKALDIMEKDDHHLPRAMISLTQTCLALKKYKAARQTARLLVAHTENWSGNTEDAESMIALAEALAAVRLPEVALALAARVQDLFETELKPGHGVVTRSLRLQQELSPLKASPASAR